MLIFFFFLWFGLFCKYSSTAAIENNGLLTISVSLSTNFMKSESSVSLWFRLFVSTFLDHLSLALPGNFDNIMHMMSGVSKHSKFVDVPQVHILSKGFQAFDMLQHLLISSVATA